jgi:hypothetical protein
MPDRMQESAARTIDAGYALALEKLAAAAFFFARETHVKQLEPMSTASPMVPAKFIFPGLTVEPVPSFYRLTGQAFRFLRRVVAEGWGQKALSSRQMRVSGPIDRTLEEGIDEVVAICDAAEELARLEIAGAAPDAASLVRRDRLAALRSDEDVTCDARGMVPLSGVDVMTGRLHIAALVGWEVHPLAVRITHMKGVPKGVGFGVEWHSVPVPVVRELDVDPSALLDRNEFRAACDEWMRRHRAEPFPRG